MKLTRKTNGLYKFVSTADQYELEQKLGRIEDEAKSNLDQICDQCCKWYAAEDKREISYRCKNCPVTRLADLIGV